MGADDPVKLKAGREQMKLYLADTNNQNHSAAGQSIRARPKLELTHRILISYHYYQKDNLDQLFAKYFEPPYPDVFGDSGAFSAWSLGKPINIQEYAEWLHKWKHLLTVYANLDVKGDVDAGLRNQEYLESQGLNPLPVFHGGEPWSILREMIRKYPYIALGGLAGSTHSGGPAMWRFVTQCFKEAAGRSVFHGFGMTNWVVMKAFPWYSVDSSSWGQGFRFGNVPVFDRRNGKFYKLSLGRPATCKQHADLLYDLGYDWREFANRDQNQRPRICGVAAISYMLAEKWLTRLNGPVEIPKREATANVVV
jgi:hypothetical protein